MESPNPKLIFQVLVAFIAFSIWFLFVWVYSRMTGKPIRTLMSQRKQLFVYAFAASLLLVILIFVAFVIRNN